MFFFLKKRTNKRLKCQIYFVLCAVLFWFFVFVFVQSIIQEGPNCVHTLSTDKGTDNSQGQNAIFMLFGKYGSVIIKVVVFHGSEKNGSTRMFQETVIIQKQLALWNIKICCVVTDSDNTMRKFRRMIHAKKNLFWVCFCFFFLQEILGFFYFQEWDCLCRRFGALLQFDHQKVFWNPKN